MNNAAPQEAKITRLDIRMAISVFICVLVATILDELGLKFPLGEMKLEVIQKMTSAISCMLVCQEAVPASWKAGVNRLIITAVGGVVGIVVILLDNVIGNGYIMSILVGLGILAVLLICKATKVPYINCRIGGVTFILVTCTLQGSARIYYSVFRLISTLFGVLVVMLVTWIFKATGLLEKTEEKAWH